MPLGKPLRSITAKYGLKTALALLGLVSFALAARFFFNVVERAYESGTFYIVTRVVLALGLIIWGALCFYALRKKRKFQVAVLAIFLTPYLAMVVADVIIQVRPPPKSAVVPAVKLPAAVEPGPEFDRRTQLQVITEMRRGGDHVYPSLAYGIYPKDTFEVDGVERVLFGGISNVKSVHCNENGYLSIVVSDRYGFRNPDQVWDFPEFDAVMVGDSFMWGSCVNEGDGVADVVRTQLPATVNLGVPALSPLGNLGVVQEYVSGRRVRYLVWSYWERAALSRIRVDLKHEITSRYLDPAFSQDLIGRQQRIDAALIRYADEWYASKTQPDRWQDFRRTLLSSIAMTHVRARLASRINSYEVPAVNDPFHFGLDVSEDLSDLDRVFGAFKAQAESLGAMPILVYLPSIDGIARRLEGGDGNTAVNFKNAVLDHTRDAGIKAVDMDGVFTRHPDYASLFPYRRDGHYTPEGYRLVAETLLADINR